MGLDGFLPEKEAPGLEYPLEYLQIFRALEGQIVVIGGVRQGNLPQGAPHQENSHRKPGAGHPANDRKHPNALFEALY
jgi:hypothetical protein